MSTSWRGAASLGFSYLKTLAATHVSQTTTDTNPLSVLTAVIALAFVVLVFGVVLYVLVKMVRLIAKVVRPPLEQRIKEREAHALAIASEALLAASVLGSGRVQYRDIRLNETYYESSYKNDVLQIQGVRLNQYVDSASISFHGERVLHVSSFEKVEKYLPGAWEGDIKELSRMARAKSKDLADEQARKNQQQHSDALTERARKLGL